MDRQKIILIFAGAWVSAALLTWFVFSRAASGKTEKMISVVAARQDLPAGTRIRQGDLKRMNIPEKDAPKTVIVDEAAVVNRVLMHPLSAGEPIVSVKTTSVTGADGISASIQHGMRAISISINDSSSAGGLIQPRSHVDVLFTRTGTMREAITATIVQDVQVISIGRLTEIAQASDPKTAPQQTGSQLRAATLLVTPDQASKVELARNQGKVSLVLRNPLDRTLPETESATAESLDPLIFAGANKALRAGIRTAVPNVRDDKVWAQISNPDGSTAKPEKKEAPKPRYIIDVYHGDKHVQELFQ